jgi:hypothetical protein
MSQRKPPRTRSMGASSGLSNFADNDYTVIPLTDEQRRRAALKVVTSLDDCGWSKPEIRDVLDALGLIA